MKDTELSKVSSLVIVGHGHSMTGSGLGKEIDSHEVFRMKNSEMLVKKHPEDYGKRTDYAGSTTAVIYTVMRIFPKAKKYFCYPKSHDKKELVSNGRDDAALKKIRIIHKGMMKSDSDKARLLLEPLSRLIFPVELHFKWLEKYYELRGSRDIRYSTGFGMIIMALDILKPETLLLAGMDSIVKPDTDWSSTLATKKYDWDNNPPHDFKSEHQFLEQVKECYETEISILY